MKKGALVLFSLVLISLFLISSLSLISAYATSSLGNNWAWVNGDVPVKGTSWHTAGSVTIVGSALAYYGNESYAKPHATFGDVVIQPKSGASSLEFSIWNSTAWSWINYDNTYVANMGGNNVVNWVWVQDDKKAQTFRDVAIYDSNKDIIYVLVNNPVLITKHYIYDSVFYKIINGTIETSSICTPNCAAGHFCIQGSCTTLHWYEGPYSLCSSLNCSSGNQTRVVVCMNESNAPLDDAFCLKHGELGYKPVNVQPCSVCTTTPDNNNDGFITGLEYCPTLFNTTYYNAALSKLNMTTGAWTYVEGEWYAALGSNWYFIQGNCSKGTYDRYIAYNFTTNWVYGNNFYCNQSGISYCTSTGTGITGLNNDTNQNGLIDNGESCSAGSTSFNTWYYSPGLSKLATGVGNQTYVDGEWYATLGNNWYFIQGNCSKGTYDRYIAYNFTTNWVYGNNFSCSQTGVNSCGSGSNNTVDLNQNGLIDKGESCSGNFSTWYYNSNLSVLSTTVGVWSKIYGESYYAFGGGWYWATGNCSQGTYPRYINYNASNGWAYGNDFPCTQTGVNYCGSLLAGGSANCASSCSYTYEGNAICIPVGLRLSSPTNKYCNITYSLDSQKADNSTCVNSYECQSNYCSGGSCVNLLAKQQSATHTLICLLKRLFSITDASCS